MAPMIIDRSSIIACTLCLCSQIRCDKMRLNCLVVILHCSLNDHVSFLVHYECDWCGVNGLHCIVLYCGMGFVLGSWNRCATSIIGDQL